MNSDYFTQKQIQERGWTKGMIDKWLGEPDQLVSNPQHPRGARVRLYEYRRVLAVENTREWNEGQVRLHQQRERRKAGATKGVKTRRKNAAKRKEIEARQGVFTLNFND